MYNHTTHQPRKNGDIEFSWEKYLQSLIFSSVGSLMYTLMTRKPKQYVCKKRGKTPTTMKFLYSPQNSRFITYNNHISKSSCLVTYPREHLSMFFVSNVHDYNFFKRNQRINKKSQVYLTSIVLNDENKELY